MYTRTTAGVVPTPAGQCLTNLAGRVLEDLIDTERSLTQGARLNLRIAAETYTYYDWLPGVLRRFERMCPRVDLEICLACHGAPLEHLLAGTIDLAFTYSVRPSADVEIWPLMKRELLLVGRPTLRLQAGKAHVTAEDLEGQRLILHDMADRDVLLQQLAASSHSIRVLLVQPTAAIIAAARAGLGLALLPEWITRDILARSELQAWRVGPTGLARSWSAVARRSGPPGAHIRTFVECMRMPSSSE